MRSFFSPWLLSGLLVAAAPAVAATLPTPPATVLSAPAAAEQFVRACHTRLDLTAEQRSALQAYLDQEINYLAVLAANHPAADVAAALPAEREQLQQVAGRLLSPAQLRQFRELEATPKVRAYLHQMSLGN